MKEGIIDSSLIIFVIIGLPLLLFSLSRIDATGWKWTYLAQILTWAFLTGLYIIKNKLSIAQKVYSLIFSLLIIASQGFVGMGILSSGKLFFILAVIFAGLFLGKLKTYYLLALIIMVYAVFFFMFHHGILKYNFNVITYVGTPQAWFVSMLVTLLVIFGLLTVNEKYMEYVVRFESELSKNKKTIFNYQRNYKAIFNALTEAIFIHDAETGEVVDVNDAMLRMYRCGRKDIIGMPPEMFTSNDSPYKAENVKNKIFNAAKGKEQVFEWHSRRFDGELFWTEVSLRYAKIDNENRVLSVVRDITERKRAEKKLNRTQKLLEASINQSPSGVIIAEAPDVNIVLTNNSALGIRGRTADNLTGITYDKHALNWQTFSLEGTQYDPKDLPLSRAVLKGETVNDERVIIRRNGKEDRLVSANAAPIKDESGNIIAGIVIFHDISDKIRGEIQLKESEERFRLLIENTPAVTWVKKEPDITTYISPNIENVYGYSQKEVYESNSLVWHERMHEEDREYVKKEFKKIFRGERYEVEYRIKNKHDKYIWIKDRSDFFVEKKGGKYAYGVFLDITKEKEAQIEVINKNNELLAAEEEIKASLEQQENTNESLQKANARLKTAVIKIEESNLKYQALFNNANDAILLMEGIVFIECNLKTLEMFEVNYEEIIDKTPLDFSPEYQPDGNRSEDAAPIKISEALEGKTQFFEWQHCTKTGKLFDVEVSLNLVKLNDNDYLQAIVRDVSLRKKAEMELLASEQKFKNIFNSSTDGIIISDINQNILNVNEKVIRFVGLQKSSLLSKKVNQLVPEEYWGILDKRLKMLLCNEPVPLLELHLTDLQGNTIPLEAISSIIRYENTDAILTIMRDISERKLLQEKIVKAIIKTEEKERSRFAKELHDGLGPILSTIKLYYQWLSEPHEPDQKKKIIEKGNKNIEEAIVTLKEISNNLSPHVLINFGIKEAVQQFIDKIAEPSIVKVNFHSNLSMRFREEVEITFYRIITELINNTIKHADASTINIELNYDANMKMIRLDYTDDGKGIDLNAIKEKKKGLGLFNMENRLMTIGGQLDITNQPNKGIKVRACIKILENE